MGNLLKFPGRGEDPEKEKPSETSLKITPDLMTGVESGPRMFRSFLANVVEAARQSGTEMAEGVNVVKLLKLVDVLQDWASEHPISNSYLSEQDLLYKVSEMSEEEVISIFNITDINKLKNKPAYTFLLGRRIKDFLLRKL